MEKDNLDWIGKIKPQFTSGKAGKALGQLTIYKSIYSMENPKRTIKKAVVFGALTQSGLAFDAGKMEIFEQVAKIFHEKDVKVFMYHPEGKFKTLDSK